ATAARAALAVARLAAVGEAPLEVPSRRDAPQGPAGPVGACDELPLAEGLVGDRLALEADRAERAGVGAERQADLVLGRRPEVGAEHTQQLRLVEPIVAADEGEHERAAGLHDRHRLRRRGLVDAEELRE